MTTTITWAIDWMESSTQIINGHTEVVLSAKWICIGVDTATPPNTSTIFGTCIFPQPQSGGSFTPYSELTQNQVLGWCWENGVDKNATEYSINAQIIALENQTQVKNPLPWDNL